MIQGKVDGRRPHGKLPTCWVDGIKNLVGLSLHEAMEMVQNREVWRIAMQMIHA